MKFLLDTHVLLWAVGMPERLPVAARKRFEADEAELWFSAASLWEVAIKSGLGREDFQVDAGMLRRGLIVSGCPLPPPAAWPRNRPRPPARYGR